MNASALATTFIAAAWHAGAERPMILARGAGSSDMVETVQKILSRWIIDGEFLKHGFR